MVIEPSKAVTFLTTKFAENKEQRKSHFILLLLLAITFIIYYPSLYYSYLHNLDDGWLIVNNLGIRDLSWNGITHLFFHDRLDAFYHPVAFLSLAIDYHFFGMNPFWMKLHSLFLHLGSGVLVWHLSKKLSGILFIICFTTGLFLLHPIQIENVAWVSCREQVLLTFYSLVAFAAFIRFIESNSGISSFIWGNLCILSFAIAILSKFIAAVVLVIFIFYVILFSVRHSKNGFYHDWKKLLWVFLPVTVIVFATYYMNLKAAENNFLIRQFDYTLGEHFILFLHSFGFYPFKVIFPLHFSCFYPAPTPGNVFEFNYLILAVFGFAFLLLLPFLTLRRNKTATIGLAIYLLGVLLTADLILVNSDLPSTVSERHFYLASFGFFLFIAYLFSKIICRQAAAGYVVAALILIGLSVRTTEQLKNCKTTQLVLESMADIYPSEEFYNRLAMEYYQNKDIELTKRTLFKSRQLSLGIEINNPFYNRIDLAAIYIQFGDTSFARTLLSQTLRADLETTNTNCINSYVECYQFYLPFTSQNYSNYLTLRTKVLQECGFKLKKGRP